MNASGSVVYMSTDEPGLFTWNTTSHVTSSHTDYRHNDSTVSNRLVDFLIE